MSTLSSEILQLLTFHLSLFFFLASIHPFHFLLSLRRLFCTPHTRQGCSLLTHDETIDPLTGVAMIDPEDVVS